MYSICAMFDDLSIQKWAEKHVVPFTHSALLGQKCMSAEPPRDVGGSRGSYSA